MGLSSVSFSFTTAIVYLVSGAVFFLLIFLLVMLGVTDCNCDCDRLVVFFYYWYGLLPSFSVCVRRL